MDFYKSKFQEDQMTTVKISGKVNDRFWAKLGSKEISGYVPSEIGIGGGDYLELEVELATGKILGWNKMALMDKFNSSEEKESFDKVANINPSYQ
jgi:hypothetical protein